MTRLKKSATVAAPIATHVDKESVFTLVVDFGNSGVKVIAGQIVIMFPHAMAEITEAEYLIEVKDLQRSEDRWDYFKFDGKFYVVGKSAVKHEIRRQGRSKYDRSYMGPFVARIAIEWMRLEANTETAIDALKYTPIVVYASHPPRDAEFAGHLSRSLKGEYAVESAGGLNVKFKISDVKTFYEAYGSYQFLLFSEPDLLVGEVGLIDIGGGTVGVMRVGADGIIIPGGSDNTRSGINQVLETLRKSIEHKYNDAFSDGHTEQRRLEEALRTGVYKAGGKGDLPVNDLVKLALRPMLNDIADLYMSRLSGGLSIDTLVMTGGGTAVSYKRVKEMLKHRATVPAIAAPTKAELDFSDIQFSNALGTRMYLDAVEAEGVG